MSKYLDCAHLRFSLIQQQDRFQTATLQCADILISKLLTLQLRLVHSLSLVVCCGCRRCMQPGLGWLKNQHQMALVSLVDIKSFGSTINYLFIFTIIQIKLCCISYNDVYSTDIVLSSMWTEIYLIYNLKPFPHYVINCIF